MCDVRLQSLRLAGCVLTARPLSCPCLVSPAAAAPCFSLARYLITPQDMSYSRIKSLVNEELKSYFRPEFLNRLDEIIVFRQLTKKEVKQIADIMLRDVFKRGEEKGLKIEVTEKFKDRWAGLGLQCVSSRVAVVWASKPSSARTRLLVVEALPVYYCSCAVGACLQGSLAFLASSVPPLCVLRDTIVALLQHDPTCIHSTYQCLLSHILLSI